ncbi:MAG TPA: Uma2 family endonuclease [Phycisphaerae bacterium]|nr:Uma2 family endonuclease [Phycisphaerae bacterium]
MSSLTKMRSQQFLMMGEDPPGLRLELVNGEIVVSPSPTSEHSDVVMNLIEILRPYVREKKLGRMLADVDTVLMEDTTRRPDLLFVSRRRAKIVQEVVMGAPDLCIEVVSPASATMDRVEKFKLYETAGVKNYWIVDPHARMVEAFVLKGGAFELAVMGRDKETVRLPPFAGLAIPLVKVWRQG